MAYKKTERRRFLRFDLNANIRFRFFDDMSIDENIKGKAKNLSAEGLCIVTKKKVPKDKHIELDISLPGRKKPARVHGKVVWAKKIKSVDKDKEDYYETGIKLYTVERDDENVILKYYCKRMISNLSQYA